MVRDSILYIGALVLAGTFKVIRNYEHAANLLVAANTSKLD